MSWEEYEFWQIVWNTWTPTEEAQLAAAFSLSIPHIPV